MNILILGAGMYVTGRHNTGTGTVLASIAEHSKKCSVEKIYIVAKNKASEIKAIEETRRINSILNTNISINFVQALETADKTIEKLTSICNFNCAIVSLPDVLHYEYTAALIKNKIHTLVVKPLVAKANEHKELISLANTNNVYCAVEFHKRFDEANLYTKKVIHEKKLGKILYFDVDYSQRITIPLDVFNKSSEQTNIFQYLGVHYVDLIYFMTGYIPLKSISIGTSGILKEKGIKAHDSIHAMILWRNPNNHDDTFLSVFNTNWIDPTNTSALSDQKYKIIGTVGRIENDHKNRGVEEITEGNGIKHINPYFSEFLPNQDGSMFLNGYGFKSINMFLNDVRSIFSGDSKPRDFDKIRPSFADTYYSSATIDAVNNSLLNNLWVDIDAID